jgi:hypothetical protein
LVGLGSICSHIACFSTRTEIDRPRALSLKKMFKHGAKGEEKEIKKEEKDKDKKDERREEKRKEKERLRTEKRAEKEDRKRAITTNPIKASTPKGMLYSLIYS